MDSSRGPGGKQRILVVCYGNICRSPIAAALLERALRNARLLDRFVVRSAGVGAMPGAPAASVALEVASARGLDLSQHRARRLTREMAREADHLIALDEVVEEEIAILAGDLPVILWPVDDPYGGPPTGYGRALEEIESRVGPFVAQLQWPGDEP